MTDIFIRQADQTVTVETGDTILDAALDADIDYPHGCQSGNCGACKSRLLSGKVDLTPYSEFALSDAEKAQGLILACRAMPLEACRVAWLELDETVQHPLKKLTCTVTALQQATHDIRIVSMQIDEGGPFTFSAGQYASVQFAGQEARDYSMANVVDSTAGTTQLDFHIRAMDGGDVSHFVNDRLKIGDRVNVEGPMGLAYLRDLHTGPIVAIAGGSGLAPIKSIVETAIHLGLKQPIHLYFGVRDERDLYLEAHFSKMAETHSNLNFIPVLSAAQGSTHRRQGFLSDAIRQDFTDLDGAKAYLAGPPIMVDTTTVVLEALGVRREDLHADPFYNVHELNRPS